MIASIIYEIQSLWLFERRKCYGSIGRWPETICRHKKREDEKEKWSAKVGRESDDKSNENFI
jgi:hypothetical protein